jgi:hypothetical protein
MGDDRTFTRRNVLRTGAAAATGLATVGTAAAGDGSVGEAEIAGAEPIPCLDLTDQADAFETVTAASVAPETSSAIGPGSLLQISRGGSTAGCTANFIWEGASGDLFLGAAGHCFLPSGAAAERNAGGSYDASGVTVEACVDCAFGGALALNGVTGGRLVELGEVVYARQSENGAGVGNDFGLVRIPDAVKPLLDPAMPKFGGPTEVGQVDGGEPVCHYGNAVAFGETFLTKGRTGAGFGTSGDSWSAGTTSAPGDSGAAVQSCQPTASGFQGVEAVGVLTHGTTSGVAGTTMRRAVEMAAEAGLDITPRLA